jgi:type I restriction enzyme S subunit
LGEIADVVGGVTKDSKLQSRPDLVEVPYLRVANVQRGRIDLTNVATIRVSALKAAQLELRPGDVLLNEGGDRDKLGRGWVWHGQMPGCIHQNHVFRARIRSDVLEPRLLAWYANEVGHRWFELNGKQSVNLASISLSKIRTFPVPIPPTAEQSRIVDFLEDHLSRLDAAITGLSQADRRTAAYKAATAVTELEAAGGEYASLAAVATTVRNGIFVSRAKPEPDGVPILRIGAVRPLLLDLTDLRYSERDRHDLAAKAALLDGGDLLFTRYNGNPRFVGACAMVPYGVGDLTYPDKLIRVKVDRNIAEPGFVALACSFGEGRRQIQSKVKTTSGQAGVSGTDLKQVAIRLPDLSVQAEVIKRVQEALDHADRIAAAMDAARRRSASLRRALLDAAFTGRLTGRASDMDLVEELAGV